MSQQIRILLFLALIASPVVAQPGGWGDIKGRVVWAGNQVLPQPRIMLAKAANPGFGGGPILNEELVIDKQTRGVKSVMVWLVDANNPKAQLPIHPMLAKVSASVSFDQPRGNFEPRVLFVRPGQTAEARNTSPVPHSINILGGSKNPNKSIDLLPSKSQNIVGWNVSSVPVSVSSPIYPWMRLYIRVVDTPYHAVTDAKGNFEIKNVPSGDFKLVVWHETMGWVVGDRYGTPITIQAGKTTDFPIQMMPK